MTEAGARRYNEFFSKLYSERWPALFAAMQKPVSHVAAVNQFIDATVVEPLICDLKPHDLLPNAFVAPEGSEFPTPPRVHGLSAYYLLDAASLVPVLALDVHPGQMILDVCAAPGGKSVLIAYAQRLADTARKGDPKNQLVVNELQKDRRQRLERVMHDYLPSSAHKNLRFCGFDATQFIPGQFDRVLVDAPCSTDRLVARDPAELSVWTSTLVTKAAQRQLPILINALRAVKPGGRLVYATCSIAPAENDDVVTAALAKMAGFQSVPLDRVPILQQFGEATPAGGWIALPDRTQYGPLYVHVLERMTAKEMAAARAAEDADTDSDVDTDSDADGKAQTAEQ